MPTEVNRWKIPAALEALVRDRDTRCIYCRVLFATLDGPRRERASWEHIVNDATLVNEGNIALCCIACNASKGAKPLSLWLSSAYCERKGISAISIAPLARASLGGTASAPT